jgi:hypothetical protein
MILAFSCPAGARLELQSHCWGLGEVWRSDSDACPRYSELLLPPKPGSDDEGVCAVEMLDYQFGEQAPGAITHHKYAG